MPKNSNILERLVDAYNADQNKHTYMPNPEAVNEMERRIKEIGRRKQIVYYSDLVAGIPFYTPLFGNVNEAHYIGDFGGWIGPERKMVGTALAEIACRNIHDADCLITSIVVLKNDLKPSPTFFDWLEWAGVIADTDDSTTDEFWLDQYRKTLDYLRKKR